MNRAHGSLRDRRSTDVRSTDGGGRNRRRARLRPPKSKVADVFDRFAGTAADHAGRAGAFVIACAVLLAWIISGPLFGFSNTWQLIINTSTTIVTFLMVFLVQHSENKNSRAVQLKLDELIAATSSASNRLIAIEDLSDAEITALHDRILDLIEDDEDEDEEDVNEDDVASDAENDDDVNDKANDKKETRAESRRGKRRRTRHALR